MRSEMIKVRLQIEKTRRKMIKLANEKDSLIDNEVLAVSQQLDRLMNSYIKLRYKNIL